MRREKDEDKVTKKKEEVIKIASTTDKSSDYDSTAVSVNIKYENKQS